MSRECKCSFVIPFKIAVDNRSRLSYFKQCIESVLNQTDDSWTAVLVDDASDNQELDDFIKEVTDSRPEKIICHKNNVNVGAGVSRNIGVDTAAEAFGADVIMFLDSDDLSHPKRTEKVARAFATKDADVIYSPFIPIDEKGIEIPEDKFPVNIKKIMNNNRHPSVGKEVWKSIVSKEMYINLTSATNVRTKLAKRIPFPNLRSSEDSITWMLYSACGGIFDFIGDIPSKYRIPQSVKNNSLSTEFGKENFYSDFAEAHVKAYSECLKYAKERKAISAEEIRPLTELVFENLAEELRIGGMHEMADRFIKRKYVFEEEMI